MKHNTLKRALLLSITAMLMCAAMLAGTTFAWFTDSASTGVNRIQAGNLSVDIVGADGKSIDGKTLFFRNNAGDTDILWEPGATFNLDSFRIVNNGSLALKYKVVINGVKGDAKLLKVIDFSMAFGEKEAVELANWEGVLLPDGKEPVAGADVKQTELITISGHMREEAGNDYQGESLDGISITVVAAQYTYESDSFDNTYDENSEYPVMNADELKAAFEKGGVINLGADANLTPFISDDDKAASALIAQNEITSPTVLNLSGKKFVMDSKAAAADYGNASPLMLSVNGTSLTINGKGKINCEAGYNQVFGIDVINGGKVIINDGTYYGSMTAVQVSNGSLEINGGFFDLAPTCKAAVPQYSKFIVNCLDASYKNGTASVSIKGGTFVNFNPSANPEGENTSYVAPGYKVVSAAQKNGDIWYTVVAE